MKVIRVVMFEGTEAEVEKQLNGSLPEGVKDLAVRITVIRVRPEDLEKVGTEVTKLRRYINEAMDWSLEGADDKDQL